jgi:hypothetical protein
MCQWSIAAGQFVRSEQTESAEIGSDVARQVRPGDQIVSRVHKTSGWASSARQLRRSAKWWRTGDKRGVFLEVSVCQMLTTFNSTAAVLRSSGANLQFQVSF